MMAIPCIAPEQHFNLIVPALATVLLHWIITWGIFDNLPVDYRGSILRLWRGAYL